MGAEFEIAFVCTGNRFRSVLAAAAFQSAVDGLPVHVQSYGTRELGGADPLPSAVHEGRELGFDVSAHRTQRLAGARLAEASLVVGFEHQHVRSAVVIAGARGERAFVLTELLGLLDLLDRGDVASEADRIDRAIELVRRAHELRREQPDIVVSEIPDPIWLAASGRRWLARLVCDGAQSLADRLFGPAKG